ncbi:M48 family metallopeptidase [Sphingopyxis sp. XHP0097]|uniref:M48 family metallopeptidase n=1 Tax=Sphingopyxis jiangsuensis TaxID=2871171 RepID=A0ABS7MEW7_9SPHN|nr:SprT family zinc-dependent metalloprotease [Sphingopyxis jiangsuensis]MBY4637296.1 M48 family metallopeptidase [Sphingopyxis jiangsuensis]
MEQHSIEIGGKLICFQLRRSKRKTMGISVLPDQAVVVSAPERADFVDIESRVRKKAGWILDTQAEFSTKSVGATPRQFKPGETFLYLGQQYRLRVDPERVGVVREGSRIIVGAIQPNEADRIRNRLVRWYMKEARQHLPAALERCLPGFRKEVERKPKLLIKPIKMRWGSYISATHTLILNRSLVQVPPPLIDYVVAHELAHIGYGDHGPAFIAHLTEKMPDWRTRKKALEKLGPELFDAPVLR